MSAPVGDLEDIVRIDADGSIMAGSDFERMHSVSECLLGMRKHLHHNGVVLDGMQRLSHLCTQASLSPAQRRANMALLGPVGLGVVLLPAMQHYHFDNRLQVHACAAPPASSLSLITHTKHTHSPSAHAHQHIRPVGNLAPE